MRAFAWFFGLVLVCLLIMGAVAYPAWVLLSPHFDFRFHRIASRVALLVFIVGLVIVARRLHVANKQGFGYGLPWRQFIPTQLTALGLGVVTMVPIAAVMGFMGLRVWKGEGVPDGQMILDIALKGLMTGLAVAFIEETIIRGAMYSAIARESGTKAAILLTSLLYAAAHFIARTRIPAEEVQWYSGFDLLAGTLRMFGEPLKYADAFVSYFAVGVLLATVRSLTGNIAACIGLHAGWVWVITFLREAMQPDDSHPLRWLTSQHDGVVGWLVLAWTVLIGLALYRFYSRRSPRRSGA